MSAVYMDQGRLKWANGPRKNLFAPKAALEQGVQVVEGPFHGGAKKAKKAPKKVAKKAAKPKPSKPRRIAKKTEEKTALDLIKSLGGVLSGGRTGGKGTSEGAKKGWKKHGYAQRCKKAMEGSGYHCPGCVCEM